MQKTGRAGGFTYAKETAGWIEQTDERRCPASGGVGSVARAKVATVKGASHALIGEHHWRECGQQLTQWNQRAKRFVSAPLSRFEWQGIGNREVAAARSTQCAQMRPQPETFAHVASE
jgi:hypothetical protein